MRASAVFIQRKWRAILSARIAHEHFLMMKVGLNKNQFTYIDLL